MNDSNPFGSFHDASKSVLQYLHQLIGFDLWMVSRTEGEDWIVLQAADRSYGVGQGDVFRWTDSLCSRMVQGLGPRIAPRTNDVPAYANAPIAQQVRIGAYVGVPLRWDEGQLFGTLCAVDPAPQPEWITEQLRVVELFGRLLSSILQAEIKASEQARRAERAQMEALTDSLTGLYNRRGWDRLFATEEARCRRYGHPACLLSIDIDYLKVINDTQGHSSGDELIKRTAQAICTSIRFQDVAARLGGDEFAVMAVECDSQGGHELEARLQQALSEHDVQASLGLANCQPNRPFAETWDLADQNMYAVKSRRRRYPRSAAAPLFDEAMSPVETAEDIVP